MAGRSPARLLAPLALVAFALALYVVVSSTTKDDAGSKGAQGTAQPAGATATPKPKGGKGKRKRRTYTIKSGDTPSGIAEKTGVPLDQILALNPKLDPQSLSPGTKIKLRKK
jgi:LysM repeat protein